jgi:DNA-directed RNA polymerase subunit RPC12/RpoP
MSEFKFACPICGQHITADSKATGSQIPCPTCYRKIVVPQAPTMDDPKFVLSASEANKPRPPSGPQFEGYQKGPEKTGVPTALIVLLVLACAAGATLFALRGRFPHSKPHAGRFTDGDNENNKSETQPQPEYTGTNLWTLDLSNAKFPDDPVGGSVHRRAFTLNRATITGSNLTLRVGRDGPVELGLNIYFFNRQPEELSGKTAEVKPTDATAPRVVLHWKEADRVSETFRGGYAMKVEFGPVAGNALPGKIFICLPDESKSWVAGTFRAEIHKPRPKARPPAPRPPPTQ